MRMHKEHQMKYISYEGMQEDYREAAARSWHNMRDGLDDNRGMEGFEDFDFSVGREESVSEE